MLLVRIVIIQWVTRWSVFIYISNVTAFSVWVSCSLLSCELIVQSNKIQYWIGPYGSSSSQNYSLRYRDRSGSSVLVSSAQIWKPTSPLSDWRSSESLCVWKFLMRLKQELNRATVPPPFPIWGLLTSSRIWLKSQRHWESVNSNEL